MKIQGLLFYPEGDLMPPPGAPNPDEPPTPRPSPTLPRKVECDFCHCHLVPATGEVLKMSDVAKSYRDASDTIEKLQHTISKVEADLASARSALAEATAQKPQSRSGLFSS